MKTQIIRLLILLLILATCAAEPVFSQNQEQLFQQALMKEEGEGALQEAINIYTKIVENSSAERLLRANAQLQIGLCYEKLGKKQANEAYNKVIKQFADQQQTAEIAKTRLQSLNSKISVVNKNPAKPTIRQIILDRNIRTHFQTRIIDSSPKGDNFVYIPEGEGPNPGSKLNVGNIAGPPSTCLITSSQFEIAWMPRYSPDGRYITFHGRKKNETWKEAKFYSVKATGGKPKPISSKPFWYFPDGKHTLHGLTVVKNLSGDTITSFPIPIGSDIENIRINDISPDSKWISYSANKKGESRNETDCWIISFSGDKSIRLTNSKGFDGFGTWSKKDYSFYFVSDRNGNKNIFRLKINPETGEKMGNAEQITFYKDADVIDPCFIEKKNALVYNLTKKIYEIVIPENDNYDSFKTIATGTDPLMSPDGTTVYFVGTGKYNEGIFSISRTGRNKKKLTDLVPTGWIYNGHCYSLSPDGTTISFFTETGKNEKQLCFLSTNNNILEKSVTIETSEYNLPTWSPDSKTVAFAYEKGLYTIPAWGNKAEKLTEVEVGSWWEQGTIRWSPDGKYIAGFVFMDGEGIENSVVIVSVKTGEIKRLTTKEEDQYKEGLEWYPDSKKLAYMYYDPENDYDGLREAYVDGSPTTEMIDQPDVWDYIGTWDPTGKYYYFVGDVQNNKIGPDLFIYDAETKKISSLVVTLYDYTLPSWSEDGKYMVLGESNIVSQLWMMEGIE